MSVDLIIYTVDYGLKIETVKIHMSNYAKWRYLYICKLVAT
jgi:hypothetical protein